MRERQLVRASIEGTVVVKWWLSGKKVGLEGRQMGIGSAALPSSSCDALHKVC